MCSVLFTAFAFSLACGSTATSGPQNGGQQVDPDEDGTTVEDGTTADGESASDDAVADDTVAGDTATDACAGLAPPSCGENPGCVFDGACRVANDVCEGVHPVPLAGAYGVQPSFRQGDPCGQVNRECAWSFRRGFCVPFVAQSACPAGREEAAETDVHCMHPDQPALDCPYDGGWCACRRPAPYCGGAAPSPEVLNQATGWACMDDLGADGCPTRPIESGARCSVDRERQCIQGCSSLYQCVRRRWRVTAHLPPRP
ncbi:MAG: hypothetical protein DRJ42_14990 [Deltaproteobacteria bacterium]|nr:MAG: hypothetical protein DRJ42_14990 [Deltaproteobacteria bacterium]